jgi:NAD(P)H-dependent flavin oxidoreductase YrpB (nitropropane dioxygenase family)
VPIVSSVKAAKLSERLGAAAIIVEGRDAGGHLGTSKVDSFLPEEIYTKSKIFFL